MTVEDPITSVTRVAASPAIRVLMIGLLLLAAGPVSAMAIDADLSSSRSKRPAVLKPQKKPKNVEGRAGGARISPRVIQSGYVIWNAEYLPPPYTVERRDEHVLLNGRPLPPLFLPAPRQRQASVAHSGTPNESFVVSRTLEQGGMLIVDSENAFAIRSDLSGVMLNALLSDQPADRKQQVLTGLTMNSVGAHVNWGELLESFDPDESLLERYQQLATPVAMVTESPRPTMSVSKQSVHYAMTVAGMVLGVLAFGMLLQHQPHVRAPRGSVDNEGQGFQLLPHYVLLVVLFGMFDLTCTIFASETGGLLELNPIGSSIMHAPALVGVLKVASTLVSAMILLKLRRYRIAQVTSWWLCLVCVFLTLRWVTFNSMFLT